MQILGSANSELDAFTDVFTTLRKKPLFITIQQIGRLIRSIDLKGLLDFEHSTHGNLRLIPPSRSGLEMHVKRAAYYAGWINYQCLENFVLPSPTESGWEW